MKRKLVSMLVPLVVTLAMFQTSYAESIDITSKDIADGVSFCKDYPVSLQVNGNDIAVDVPPVIIKDRTLIPVRAVFESLGSTVVWDEATKLVEVSIGTSGVKLIINSKIAIINGEQVTLEVPPLIIDGRTMIPVRFVAESLNFGIAWNGESRTVNVSSPLGSKTTNSSVDLIKVDEMQDIYRITIQGRNVLEGCKSFAYEDPERFGVDIPKANLAIENASIEGFGNIINAVRYSQFEAETVRVVVDLKEKVAGRISYSLDKNSIYIDFNKSQNVKYEDLGDVTIDGLDVVDWRATEKLVIIDPGHGGSDTGSQAIRNSVEILNEKDVNLDVALRLNRMLKAAGVSTYLLRETDSTLTLSERPILANAANGELYVAIHNNSSVSTSPNGIETYYYSKQNESNYGISSQHLAEVVQQEMVQALGISNRGSKSEPAYAVLNKTQMPSIIIEGAFLSNTDNLNLMLTDAFRQSYAMATAKGIIQILNESVGE